ncbi:MAG: hypothetical protein M3011_02770, partial [Actinomycetota bacterium]|nr:hypothetical protein [Actinomycetota bacterium]
MARLVTRRRVDDDGLAAIRRPRTDLLLERDCGGDRFEAVEGPVRDYLRTVVVTPAPGTDHDVTQTVEFALTVPYFWWLFYIPFRRALARPGR